MTNDLDHAIQEASTRVQRLWDAHKADPQNDATRQAWLQADDELTELCGLVLLTPTTKHPTP